MRDHGGKQLAYALASGLGLGMLICFQRAPLGSAAEVAPGAPDPAACASALVTRPSPEGPAHRYPNLRRIAAASLEANLAEARGRTYLAAGARQFRSLWTRDFCFSVRGLLAIGRADVARAQLELLVSLTRPQDGLVPRVVDSESVQWRVALASAGIALPLGGRKPLRAEYRDERGVESIDANALALIAALDLAERTGDWPWWRARLPEWRRIFGYYDRALSGGLIRQPRFSDWQDSVRREGATFYANYLYWVAAARLARIPGAAESLGIDAVELEAMRLRIREAFRDPGTGLYRSLLEGPWISLEANLLLLEDAGGAGFEPDPEARRALYLALRDSPLWRASPLGLPGRATWPDYPAGAKSPAPRWAGVGGYHDEAYWPWLMALAAKVARRFGDDAEADRILAELERLATRDGAVGEIHRPVAGLPAWRSLAYRSEQPFSWGAAFVLDALDAAVRR